VVERGDVEALEQPEDRQRGEALGRRRKARGLAGAVRQPERLDPGRLVFREIVEGERAADGRCPGGQPPGERAAIEVLRPVTRDRGQRGREGGLREASVCDAL